MKRTMKNSPKVGKILLPVTGKLSITVKQLAAIGYHERAESRVAMRSYPRMAP